MSESVDDWPLGRLLSMAARLVEHSWNDALEQRGLTHAGLITLHFLDGGPLSQTELARFARVENQTMSRTVERLEREGLVRREADPRDRRRQIVTRTDAGTAAWASTRDLEAELFPRLEHPETLRDQLVEIIQRSSEGRW
ncbi:DNA-binding MarR family transcriptional regulator [Salinibacterium sp. CAN_S4]|uniref:MarR family winged helix-turn-helix transcriptional regulator n=1 Tax=Salinibacterium sp. CAN_S4 TaxID=2787727 RepID=UPI0018F02581